MKSNYPDYEGYEDLSRFTPGQLQAYRQMLLEKTQKQVDFIGNHVWMPHFYKKPGLKVLEIGSGNGRLLIGLHNQGLLEEGLGLDISESRTLFALKWRNDVGLDFEKLDFHDVDVLDEIRLQEAGNIDYSGFDLAVCITGCFQYFYPIAPDAGDKVLSFMRNSAKYALFELYKKPQMGRTWRRLPEGDPWLYLLDEYKDNGDWVEHTKTFIKGEYEGWLEQEYPGHGCVYREDTKTENLAYYTKAGFLRKLHNAGFTNVHWAKEDNNSIVILVS